MRSSLSDRLRQVIGGAVPMVAPDAATALRAGPDLAANALPAARVAAAAATLGGRVLDRAEGRVIVVDRAYAADACHGRIAIGPVVATLGEERDALGLLGRVWPSARGLDVREGGTTAPRLCFLDLETTGLAGGAGTHAFLVGCAVADRGGIQVRQFLLPGFEHERALLAEVAAWASEWHALVTFNGRSFDVPLIETRYLFHRLACPLAERPHLDMLHAARRLWRQRSAAAGAWPGAQRDDESCRLAVLEKYLAGLHRVGDVPGFEIPSRYFQFVRDGDARPLEAVLEHNRLDLVSLAVLTARALQLVSRGPSETMDARECLGLGRLYERAGSPDEAEACFAHAAADAGRTARDAGARGEAYRRLALIRRRGGRAAAAAEAWQQLAELPGCSAELRREAREALAIHHEHRSKDLDAARRLVLDVLAEGDYGPGRRHQAAEHRLRRLERKLSVRSEGGLMAALDGDE